MESSYGVGCEKCIRQQAIRKTSMHSRIISIFFFYRASSLFFYWYCWWCRHRKIIRRLKMARKKKSITLNIYTCGWQRFRWKFEIGKVFGEIIVAFRSWRYIIITFGCAFAQEKYLIAQFMHVSSFATNIIVVCCVRLGEYGSFEQFGKCLKLFAFFGAFDAKWCGELFLVLPLHPLRQFFFSLSLLLR